MIGLERVHHSWKPLLNTLNTDYFIHFFNEVLPNSPYHPKNNILRVFEKPVYDIKVVILGQEPHYFPNKATGLAYAVDQIVDLVTQDVAGVHLYTMNNAETARHIYEATHSLFKHHSQVGAL